MPVMIKFLGLIVAGMIVFTPLNQQELKPDPSVKIENAQVIANQLGKSVKVWMDGIGHVRIQPADQAPTVPFTILHSTWIPR